MVKEKKVMTEVKLIPMSGRRFTEFDDYLIHQVPDTFDVMGYGLKEPKWTEHTWVHLIPPEPGKPFINNLFSIRPNEGYMHCNSLAALDDKQYNFRGCRPIDHDRADTTVGPFSLKHIKPTHLSRLTLAGQPDSQVSFEVEFERRSEAQIWPLYEFQRIGEPFRTQWVHTTQSMLCTKGQIKIAGKTFDAKGYQAFKDHCWGLRGPKLEQTLIAWIFAAFPDRTIELSYREDKDGTMFDNRGLITWDSGKAEWIKLTNGKFSFEDGTWQMVNGEWTFLSEGKGKKLTAKFVYPGIYWSGLWTGEKPNDYKGPLRIENDIWDLTKEKQLELGKGYRTQFCLCYMDGKQSVGSIEYGFE